MVELRVVDYLRDEYIDLRDVTLIFKDNRHEPGYAISADKFLEMIRDRIMTLEDKVEMLLEKNKEV